MINKADLNGKHLKAIRLYCFDIPLSQERFGEKINFSQVHISNVESLKWPVSSKMGSIIESKGYLGKLNLLLSKKPEILDDLDKTASGVAAEL